MSDDIMELIIEVLIFLLFIFPVGLALLLVLMGLGI